MAGPVDFHRVNIRLFSHKITEKLKVSMRGCAMDNSFSILEILQQEASLDRQSRFRRL
jgi:hypothetical protein